MANWVESQAQALAKEKYIESKEEIVFETGFGASGLPHIGTFAEVARTTMVLREFGRQTGKKTKLICFSDDMDALRKVPENLPNQKMLGENLNFPLTQIPDPFGEEESFAHYNNKKLRSFLDRFGFDYEFASATDYYKSGKFDDSLQKILENYEPIKNIVKKTLREERQKTYSPFLPICPRTGKVLMVEITKINVNKSTIEYIDPETEESMEVSIKGGACKLQWKVDWAMRWIALGVDYEMAGKDLTDSVKLSSSVCHVLKVRPPKSFIYELFLDENGEKISKSRGNGLTLDEWLRYAPVESLSRFLFRPPKSARRLHFDIIPASVDDYIKDLNAYNTKQENTIQFISKEEPQGIPRGISFSILLNLVSASQAETPEMLWQFVQHLNPDVSPQNAPFLNTLINCTINYFTDFIKPHKTYRAPTQKEREALEGLSQALTALPKTATAQEIQNIAYDIGNKYNFELREWFQALYQILLGQDKGSRFGSFAALYGLDKTIDLIKKKL